MAEPARRIDPAVDEAKRVYAALKRFALRECKRMKCYGPDGVITGIGKSPEDLASDAMITLFALGWEPGKSEDNVLPLGRAIIRNKVTDIVRSCTYRTSVALDIEELEKRKEAWNETTP